MGEIYTYADDDDYVQITTTIKENNSSLFRMIKVYTAVYREGKIEEEEWSRESKFKRKRVILESGLWEEYSIHDDTGFGVRRVVYPDGQQFTNEVYGWGWNAIGEETCAIQNKSIPYLLRNNNSELKEYKFVTEVGSFDIIYLGWNCYKENLNSRSDKIFRKIKWSKLSRYMFYKKSEIHYAKSHLFFELDESNERDLDSLRCQESNS